MTVLAEAADNWASEVMPDTRDGNQGLTLHPLHRSLSIQSSHFPSLLRFHAATGFPTRAQEAVTAPSVPVGTSTGAQGAPEHQKPPGHCGGARAAAAAQSDTEGAVSRRRAA